MYPHSLCIQLCDGAAAVIVASEEAVAKHGLTPLARVVGYGIAGMYFFERRYSLTNFNFCFEYFSYRINPIPN